MKAEGGRMNQAGLCLVFILHPSSFILLRTPSSFEDSLRFGTQHKPPYIVGAGPHSASKLLRTLSMVAASKPTSWLSACSHFLSH